MSVKNEGPHSNSYDGNDSKICRYTNHRPNLWDLAFFGNLTRVILRGTWRAMDAQDLNPLHTSFTAKNTSERIHRLFTRKQIKNEQQQKAEMQPKNWDSAVNDREVLVQKSAKASGINMLGLVAQAFWPYFLFAWTVSVVDTVLNVIPSLLMARFYDFLSNSEETDEVGYYIAGLLILVKQLQSMTMTHVISILHNVGLRCRSGFSSLIYQKTLRLSSKASKEFSTGDIINLVTMDVQCVMAFASQSVDIFCGSISIVLTFFLVYRYLGWYCLAAAAVSLLSYPINGLATRLLTVLQRRHMKLKDERLGVITEVINNAKIIKLYAWENSFIRRIRDIRIQESRLMYIYLGASNVLVFIWNCFPFLTSTAALAAFLFLNEGAVLDGKTILVSISYFDSISGYLSTIPMCFTQMVRCTVSLKRIRNFLEADEVDTGTVKNGLTGDEEISLKNATVSWTEEESPVLNGVDLSVRKGELVAVVGSVAAGKSSLIQAIIGEMKLIYGSINRKQHSTLAYVPQQAWILNDTIKRNILFGSHFKQTVYEDIMKKCCLVPDLKILPAGDETEIGEKGVNLSGGQKQRLSLARAIYQDADIYLLDDPLSAVDAHVAQNLFEEVIGPRGLLAKKTRLLVTHTISILPFVDRIVVVDQGTITHQGTYDEIMKQNVKLKELFESHITSEVKEDTDVSVHGIPSEHTIPQLRARAASTTSTTSAGSDGLEEPISQIPSGRITEEEEMQVGKVRWKVYIEYISHFGILGTILTLFGYAMFQLALNGSLYFISMWGEKMKEQNGTTTEDAVKNMEIYLAFGGVQALSTLIGFGTLSIGSVWAATSLQNKMLHALMRAPMCFFESTPTGRILNRFSRDLNELEQSLYYAANGCLGTIAQFVVVVVLICIQLPVLQTLLLPLMMIFLIIQQFYMRSSRQFKRFSLISKSPVLNSFNETISGTTSIRAYKSQQTFIQNNMQLLDNHQNCTLHENTGSSWLAIRLNAIGSVLCGIVVFLLTYYRAEFSPVMATLLLSFALQATFSLTYVVRLGAQMENSFVSAERVLEYSKIEPEAPWDIKDDVPAHWPDRGQVIFEDYSTRYRKHLDLVIKQISLQISPGEKVGVVGRTGAGKSSLTLALLRILEAAEGRILIDDIDISKIGLHKLRSRIAIIPQDPVLFKGSLRHNVDPENKYSDEEIRDALWKSHFNTKEKSIEYLVDEAGANLSVGERQLVCLARALLRNSKVLILDEATAAVDMETDALIQRTIRRDFKDCTVITIAHRLHTIMDYNKIVVMDRGGIVEVGSPQDLLQNADSLFSALAKDANIRSHVA